MTVWVGAGFAGLLVVLGLDLVKSSPLWLQRSALTLFLLGAAALARARVGFEWKATTIERFIEDGKARGEDPYPGSPEWPENEELFWTAALWSLLLAGFICLFSIWWLPIRQLIGRHVCS